MVLGRQFSLFSHSPDGTVQAPLFASPRELVQSRPVLGDVADNGGWQKRQNLASDGYETYESIRQRKLDESKGFMRETGGKTLYDHIADDGVQEPLTVSAMPPHLLDEPEAGHYLHVLDGHHRLFSALESRPDDHILLRHSTEERIDRALQRWGLPRRYPGQPN
jgi:hypothetical protein